MNLQARMAPSPRAQLDDAHIGDILGAIGTCAQAGHASPRLAASRPE